MCLLNVQCLVANAYPFRFVIGLFLLGACLATGHASASSQELPLPTESDLSRNPALATGWANRMMAHDPKVRVIAEGVLVQGAGRSLPLLRRFLNRHNEDLHLATFEILRRIGPAAIPMLVDMLRQDRAPIRRSAVDALIDLSPDTERIQPALRRALRDPDSLVARDAARALGALGQRAGPSVSALVQALSHEEPHVRLYSAEALASIGPKAAKATKDLARAVGDPIPGVRWAACEALASIGPAAQPAVPQLSEALKDEFLYVRLCAAGALGSIGPKARTALGPLRVAAGDPALRNEAEWALNRIAGVESGEPVVSPLVPAATVAPQLHSTVTQTGNPPVDWDTITGRNIVWSVELGNDTFGQPVVAGDTVYVGTDNARHLNPACQEECGVLMAFWVTDSTLLWQDVAPRVQRGLREFLLPSTTSAPCVEGNRLYYVTAECQLRCLDTQGFRDGENNGPYREEVFQDNAAADIIWELDLCARLGVFPHEASNSEVLPVGDLLIVATSNGQNEGHTRGPSPRAPSLIAVDKHSGEVVWRAIGPGGQVLHGQWSSPVAANVYGRTQVLFGAAMAGCAPTTRRRAANSGALTATRKTPAGCRAPASFRAVRSLLHRSSPTAASSLPWGKIHSTATDLRLSMRSVPTAGETSPKAVSSGLLARSVAWWERSSRRTVCCTLGTWAERFIVWTRPLAPTSGSTRRTGPSGDAFCWPATGSTLATWRAA